MREEQKSNYNRMWSNGAASVAPRTAHARPFSVIFNSVTPTEGGKKKVRHLDYTQYASVSRIKSTIFIIYSAICP